MAVEKYVNILGYSDRAEQVRVSGVIEDVHSPRAHLSQRVRAAVTVGDKRRVLGNVCALVNLKTAGESGKPRQACRNVAIVVDHRLAKLLLNICRQSGNVIQRNGEEQHSVNIGV